MREISVLYVSYFWKDKKTKSHQNCTILQNHLRISKKSSTFAAELNERAEI